MPSVYHNTAAYRRCQSGGSAVPRKEKTGMSVQVILEQTLIIFCYMLIGWVLCKTKVATGEHTQFLSRLITTLTLPLNILASTNIETQPEDLLHMLEEGLLLMGMLVLSSTAGLWLGRRMTPTQRAAFTCLGTYPNCGFMGIPLCTALLGSWGSLYGAAAVAGFNVLYFTWGAALFHPGQRFEPKTLITPLNITTAAAILMLALRWHLPDTLQTVCYNVGNMTTPLALIVMGIMIGQGKLREVFCSRLAYAAAAMRNLVWPLVMLAVLAVLPLDHTMELAVMVFAVMPSANLTAVFAAQYNVEPALCSRSVALSTLLSLATMPLLLSLAELVL